MQEQLRGDVQHIYSTRSAFAAVLGDGRVVTWGSDNTAVQEQLRGDVQHIYSTTYVSLARVCVLELHVWVAC